MKRFLKGLLGISPSSIIRGFRFGFREFRRSSGLTTWHNQPFESRALRRIPLKNVDTLLTRRSVRVIQQVKPHTEGALPLNEASALLALLVDENPSIVLEIGTFMGDTTYLMATNCPNAIIHTLDLPLDFKVATDPVADVAKDDFHLIAARLPGKEFFDTPEATRIHQHFADSATWDFGTATGATFFFIDGSHTYSYVKNDSENCLKLCRGKGAFLWHDCDDEHPGVVRLLGEWRRQGREIVRIAGTNLAYWKAV
jgi:hypothetical protein